MSLSDLADALVPSDSTEHVALSAELDRRIFDMNALLKAVEALHNELDLDALCTLLVAMTRERLQVREVALLVHDETQGKLIVAVAEGLLPDVLDVELPAEDGILWRLLLAGEPFSVLDLQGRPRFPETFQRLSLIHI